MLHDDHERYRRALEDLASMNITPANTGLKEDEFRAAAHLMAASELLEKATIAVLYRRWSAAVELMKESVDETGLAHVALATLAREP